MRFHIVHIIPNPKLHGLHGYDEVIQTVQWGLNELGHETTVAVNSVAKEKTNIIFGGQMLTEHALLRFPPDSVFYNFEQLARIPEDQLWPVWRAIARQFQVWEYCPPNLEVWQQFQPKFSPLLVPVGWAPILRRIPKRDNEEIDVLFYGFPSTPRFAAYHQICMGGMKAVFACGLYGKERDELIARAKIVLNISRFVQSRILEIARVSYLLANGKAVVSDIYPDSFIEPDLKDAVAFSPPEGIAQTCQNLLGNDQARRELENRGKAAFERRDIREILQTAMEAMK
ncbi:MAG TPA: hypothetical protein VHX86_01480 [Tepidisphaeraceae bacterium]|jgi:hypothetical protein|nr:hypothetical protein [Tepidisphaeraceae bacterium]